MFGDLPLRLAENRRVIGVDLQGHGRTADIERPITLDPLGGRSIVKKKNLDIGQIDLLGYSLGGGAALSAAIRHPEIVRRLVLVSTPFRRSGWYPEIREQMKMNNRNGFEMMR